MAVATGSAVARETETAPVAVRETAMVAVVAVVPVEAETARAVGVVGAGGWAAWVRPTARKRRT